MISVHCTSCLVKCCSDTALILALDLRHVCLFFSRPWARGNLFLEVSVWMGKCFCRPVRLILRWSTAASSPLTYHKHSRKQQFCLSFCATSSFTTTMSSKMTWCQIVFLKYCKTKTQVSIALALHPTHSRQRKPFAIDNYDIFGSPCFGYLDCGDHETDKR